MYSRRYYPRKSRSYNRKKRINRKFSPALYKHDIPTFFQQKGRILQTSPLRLNPIPTQLPNSKTLQTMYNVLLKAKYPNVGPVPPPPPIPPLQSYVVSFNLNVSDIYNLTNHRLTPTDLAQLTNTYGDLSPLLYGWDYQFDLYTIAFRQSIPPDGTDSTQFHLDLVNPILTDPNPYPFVYKTVNTSVGPNGNNFAWLCSLIPIDTHSAKITRAAYTTGAINFTTPTISTNDNNITDNGWYPFVSTNEDFSQYDNYIEYVPNSEDLSPLELTLTVLCTPIQSS